MSESKRQGPDFQPGDALHFLGTKIKGRVTEFGGAEFEDGTVWDSIDLRDAWHAGCGLAWGRMASRVGRAPRKRKP